MEIQSPYRTIRGLESQVTGVLSAIDAFLLPHPTRKVVTELQHQLVDARLDVRDYELSETRDEQLARAKAAKERLTHLRILVLEASEHGIFSAIDVAQLTATIEQTASRLV